MSYEIGKVYNQCERVGYRDSVHTPVILVQFNGEDAQSNSNISSVEGGTPVEFTDETLTKVRLATGVTHAVIDPFVSTVTNGQFVHVFIVPGAVDKLQHIYNLSLESLNRANTQLARTVLTDGDIEYLNDSCRGCYN